MAEAVLMMALSPTMNEGVIAEWMAKEGQVVKSGEVLCEVETDKATMAYEASAAGTLLKILKPAGSKAAVGDAIAVIGKPGEDWQATAGAIPAAGASKSGPASIPEMKMPEIPTLPASRTSGQMGNVSEAWQASPPVSQPAHQPIPRTAAGLPADAVAASGPVLRSGYPPSSPLARNKAAEAGLDLRVLRGSGPKGRVVARDVEAAVKAGAAQAGLAGSQVAGQVLSASGGFSQTGSFAGKADGLASAKSHPQPAAKAGLRDERVPLSRMRTIIAERLSASYAAAPHFFVRAAVDMENLVALRASLNAGRETGLGLNAFIMKLVAAALERHPVINASWEGDAIRFRGSADIGLAVALEGGLITPVVRSCESLGIAAIDAALADLVPRARSGALAPQEYSEASFTIDRKSVV